MKKPIILICSELISILEDNIHKLNDMLDKIKEDSSLKEPFFIYSYAMFEGAITMIMVKFCNAFPEKVSKEVFSTIDKNDLIFNTSTKEALKGIIERFVIKINYGNKGQWIKNLNEILGISIDFDSKVLFKISEVRNCLAHNNRNYKSKISSKFRLEYL